MAAGTCGGKAVAHHNGDSSDGKKMAPRVVGAGGGEGMTQELNSTAAAVATAAGWCCWGLAVTQLHLVGVPKKWVCQQRIDGI